MTDAELRRALADAERELSKTAKGRAIVEASHRPEGSIVCIRGRYWMTSATLASNVAPALVTEAGEPIRDPRAK